MGLNPEGESLTADPCGGRDGSEGRAGLGCLVSVSGSVSVLPKASPDPPRRRAPEGSDCVSGEDLGLGRGKAEDADRGGEDVLETGEVEDTDRVGEDVPWTLLAPWVRGGGDGVCGDDGGKKWRGLPRGVLKFKIDLGGDTGDSSRRALKRPPMTWGIGRGACGCQRGKEESL